MIYSSMFPSSDLIQLKIYYLFAHADGELSAHERNRLNDISQKFDLSESRLQEYQDFCRDIDSSRYINNAQVVIIKIKKILEENSSALFWRMDSDKEKQAQTIWTLINLGYADKEYSVEEQEVVNYLIKRWELDSTLVDEFIDTANTLLALTLQKEWITSSSMPYPKINSIVKEIDRSIASMFSNIETSISEVEIA